MISQIKTITNITLSAIKERTYLAFIIIGLLGGVIMALTIPPMLGIDEFRHFNRVVQLSQGGWSADVQNNQVGGGIPISVANYEWMVVDTSIGGINTSDKWSVLYSEAFKVPMAGPERMEAFPGSAAYNIFPYLPAVVTIGVSDWLDASVGTTLLSARIAMLFSFVLIVGFSLYITRHKRMRWFIVAVALLPKVIFQAATLNADTLAIALSLLIFAVLYTRFSDGEVKRMWAWIALISATVLALVKFTYIPLALLAAPLITNAINFKGRVKRTVAMIVAALVIITPTIGWTVSVAEFADSNNEVPAVVAGVEPTVEGKISFLMNNPGEAILLFPRTFVQNFSGGDDYLQTMVGNIGFNNVRTPTVVIVFSWLLLLLSAWYALGEIKNKLIKRFITQMIIASLMAIVIVFGVLYASWTPAGSSVVEGVQGRYFIPAIIFLLPALTYLIPIKIKISETAIANLVIYGSLAGLLIATVMYWVVTYEILY